MFYDPQWDTETGQLSFNYAADIVRVIFVKDDAGNTVTAPPAAKLPQVYVCDYFTVAFPENWEQDEYYTYSSDQYYSTQYTLKDDSGWTLSSVQVTVSVTEAAEYRSGINELLEYANEDGRDTLDTVTIGGLPFQSLTYGDYWTYAELSGARTRGVCDHRNHRLRSRERAGRTAGYSGLHQFFLPDSGSAA